MKKIFIGLLALGALFEIAGCCLVNAMMFHPVKGGYDESLAGYVDIGTNGVRIAAMTVGPERGKKAIIRCHGNAEDMFGSIWLLRELADRGYMVASVEYPGYGLSDGEPDEAGCYRNVHRLYDWLVEERGFNPGDIIVDGFSIGTGPATELAATKPVGGLVLEAAFLSAPRVVTRVRLLPMDPFPNLVNIKNVKCPVLQFHGTADGIIPFEDGKELFGLAPEPKRFVTVEGAGHNNLALVYGPDAYLDAIEAFAEGASK
ncbi:MAG: alpha/beta hydrolase [Kiritimatiellae bacterium]|nr:alpha/beta hydrolase [Kiritimatiellia bacterium]